MTGYQIAHLGLCAIGAFALAAFGSDVLAAIWTSISAVSTFGPGVGTGPSGRLADLSVADRLLLVPLMLAGRLSVLPVLLGVVSLARAQKLFEQRLRRVSSDGPEVRLGARREAGVTVLSRAATGRPNTALHVMGIALVFVAVGMASRRWSSSAPPTSTPPRWPCPPRSAASWAGFVVGHHGGGGADARRVRRRGVDVGRDDGRRRVAVRAGGHVRGGRRRFRRTAGELGVRGGVGLQLHGLDGAHRLRVPRAGPDDVPPAHPVVRRDGHRRARRGRPALPGRRRPRPHLGRGSGAVVGPPDPSSLGDGQTAVAHLRRVHRGRRAGVVHRAGPVALRRCRPRGSRWRRPEASRRTERRSATTTASRWRSSSSPGCSSAGPTSRSTGGRSRATSGPTDATRSSGRTWGSSRWRRCSSRGSCGPTTGSGSGAR